MNIREDIEAEQISSNPTTQDFNWFWDWNSKLFRVVFRKIKVGEFFFRFTPFILCNVSKWRLESLYKFDQSIATDIKMLFSLYFIRGKSLKGSLEIVEIEIKQILIYFKCGRRLGVAIFPFEIKDTLLTLVV